MSQVKITFPNAVTGATAIEIYRDTANPPVTGTLVATLSGNAATWTDPTPPLGQVSYRARAVNTSVTPPELGPFDAWVSIMVTAMTGALGALTLQLIP